MPEKGERIAGVPRRFSMARLLLLVTFFAILFATMQLLGASKYFFAAFTLLVIGVGLAQAVLFGGKNPRGASMLAGAILTPTMVTGTILVKEWAERGSVMDDDYVRAIWAGVMCLWFAPCIGYFVGCLIAAVFLNSNEEKGD